MKLGFTGTRDGLTFKQTDTLAHHLLTFMPQELHHGDCVGADAMAHDLTSEHCKQTRIIIHPPASISFRAFKAGHESRDCDEYLERNRHIVDETSLLIATPKEYSEQHKGGTWFTVRYARLRRRPIYIIWPDGLTSIEQPKPAP